MRKTIWIFLIASAIALTLLSIPFWRQKLTKDRRQVTEEAPLSYDDNGDPLLPMPFHTAKAGAKTISVSAQDVIKEFQLDADKARGKYENINTWVNGTVTEVSVSGPTIMLEGPSGIECVYLSISEQKRLGVGQKVTIEGWLGGSKEKIILFRPWKKTVAGPGW